MLRLDTDKLYYRPSAGDEPPVVYTLGEIVSMMERLGNWRADSRPRRYVNGRRRKDGGGDMEKTEHAHETNEQGLVAPKYRAGWADKVFYCRELRRKMTYAEMLDGIDPEVWPQDEDELDLLLFCFDAEEVA